MLTTGCRNYKYIRPLFWFLCDSAAFWLSALLIQLFGYHWFKNTTAALWLLLGYAATIAIFFLFSLHRQIYWLAGFSEAIRVVWAALADFVFLLLLIFFFNRDAYLPFLFFYLIFLDLLMCARFSGRMYGAVLYRYRSRTDYVRVMIVGGGSAGHLMISEMKTTNKAQYRPVCVIDDDPNKLHTLINGVPVVGNREEIPRIARQYLIQQIYITIPSAKSTAIREIYKICAGTGCRVMIVPGIYQLLSGGVKPGKLREINVSDLLERDPISINTEEVFSFIQGKTVLVTGGGGSIGSELCRQIAEHQPARLVIFDIYENNAYDIENELKRAHPDLNLTVLIGSVRDEQRVHDLFRDVRPNIVFHAAAHKHVPLMEDSPNEAIKNNVFGTLHVAKTAGEFGVDRFVMISTDKAVNPTNVMGATKRICEMIVQTLGKHSTHTEYVAVRFGNVLGSNGSVVPLFRRQIAEGGPVTVTDPEIIRYFMTIPEAAALVLQAGANAKGGEIFVLDMGKPVKILTLAENLIRLSGYEPYRDIDIKFTGLRPGEKLYEELLMDEEGLRSTSNKKIYIGQPIQIKEEVLWQTLSEMKEVLADDHNDIRPLIKQLVPTYHQPDAGRTQSQEPASVNAE